MQNFDGCCCVRFVHLATLGTSAIYTACCCWARKNQENMGKPSPLKTPSSYLIGPSKFMYGDYLTLANATWGGGAPSLNCCTYARYPTYFRGDITIFVIHFEDPIIT